MKIARSEMLAATPSRLWRRQRYSHRRGQERGLTLVEMLVAISISLLMMAAVVTVFANISGSISRRRATIEMASSLRTVRETLARDLAGATCPTVPDQRPESNHGYFEIIEGPQNDYYPTPWAWDGDADGVGNPIGATPGIDLSISSLPGSNLRGASTSIDDEGRGVAIGPNTELPEEAPTDARGLGDADDTLMLTVRNEKQPFVGRIPLRNGTSRTPSTAQFTDWAFEEVESPLAEVIWFAFENPVERSDAQTFAFGEPGYRTIHRRALLIMPDLDYRIDVTPSGIDTNERSTAGRLAGTGVVRVLPPQIGVPDVSQVLASLVAFQDQYDLSVRVEWDPSLPDGVVEPAPDRQGRWVLRANTLGDLTKRENRYEHHGYVDSPRSTNDVQRTYDAGTLSDVARFFPFAAVSGGRFTTGSVNCQFVNDVEVLAATGLPNNSAAFRSVVVNLVGSTSASAVVAYEPDDDDVLDTNRRYAARPFVVVNNNSDTPATARAILNEDGYVVHVTRGLAPLGGDRRGDDVVLTNALAFDLRVFDPGAPVYGYYLDASSSQPVNLDQVIEPGDPAWAAAFLADVPEWLGPTSTTLNAIGNLSPSAGAPFQYLGRGAYVDLGYGSTWLTPSQFVIANRYNPTTGNQALFATSPVTAPLKFFTDGILRTPGAPDLTSLYRTYDTWSWHYETNGLNEDRDREVLGGVERPMIDEGTNGFDDRDPTDSVDLLVADENDRRFNGPDDPAEREAPPAYQAALRGLQVTLRTYEPDSRQVREVRVRESFVPE